MISIDNLAKRFETKWALRDFNYSFPSSGIVGIVGPNGCGKTTLFNLITGFLRPTSGSVRFRGMELTHKEPWEIARLGIARTFQRVDLFDSLSLGEHLELGRRLQKYRTQSSRSQVSTALLHETETRLLAAVGLTDRIDKQVSEFSYGQRKIASIVTALLTGSEILLLDEPASGLAPHLRVEVAKSLRGLADSRMIVVIEHNFTFLKGLADSLVVMSDGGVAADGSPSAIQKRQDLIRAYLG